MPAVCTIGPGRSSKAPQNNWRGAGQGFNGYFNPELDRLVAAFSTALESADRNQIAADIVRLYSTDLPSLSLFFPVTSWVFTSDLIGPKLRPASGNVSWNVHEWELR